MRIFSLVAVGFGLSLCAGMVGCSLESTAPAGVTTGLQMHGMVHGGQQPVSGAHVYLLAAGTSGYGGPSVSVMTTGDGADAIGNYVVTDSGGRFTLGNFTCSGTQQLYALATGGDPGAGTNSAIGEMAVVGGCGAFGPSFFLAINEVSTVAAAYAMAGFATDATHVSSSGTALAQVGVTNAFANAGNLVTLGTGKALATTPAGNGTVPQATINTLANILAACVNSNGGTTIVTSSGGTATQSPPPCGTLFANAVEGSSQPSDTATAAINMAHHPAANVAALYGLQTATAPFQAGLTAIPNDLALVVSYTGSGGTGSGGLLTPTYLAVNSVGELWIADAANGVQRAVKLSPLGAPLSPDGGLRTNSFNVLDGVGVDPLDNVWILNDTVNRHTTLFKLSDSGELLSSASGFGGGGFDVAEPISMTIDGYGAVWVATTNTSVNKMTNDGTAVTAAPGYRGAGIDQPQALAVDANENIWISNDDATLSELTNSAVGISPAAGYGVGGYCNCADIALDSNGTAWVANESSYLVEVNHTGMVQSPTYGFSGGGLKAPRAIAIDGAGNPWIANVFSISEFSSSGAPLSPATGYSGSVGFEQYHHLPGPFTIAIDGSGNVWAVDDGHELLQFIGIAVPVVTPIALAAKNGTLGTRP